MIDTLKIIMIVMVAFIVAFFASLLLDINWVRAHWVREFLVLLLIVLVIVIGVFVFIAQVKKIKR